MTPIEKPIPRAKTGWQSVKFGGISQGNICEMSHISSISGIEDLKVELWDRFSSFFTLQNTESIATNQSIINELYVEQNTISVQEGRSKLISHLIRERDRTIIIEKKNAAIRNNTLKCEVCKFSFKDKYQVNFMECHHIDPIGSGIIRETTMERLALVCPNCHRMLHRKFENRFLSIDELKFRFHL
jgi:predicted HNH restriction endonuclease